MIVSDWLFVFGIVKSFLVTTAIVIIDIYRNAKAIYSDICHFLDSAYIELAVSLQKTIMKVPTANSNPNAN